MRSCTCLPWKSIAHNNSRPDLANPFKMGYNYLVGAIDGDFRGQIEAMARIVTALDLISRMCAGGLEAGPLGTLSQAERFHWLVSSRSTVIQVSLVHCGLCTDPKMALENLFDRLVR